MWEKAFLSTDNYTHDRDVVLSSCTRTGVHSTVLVHASQVLVLVLVLEARCTPCPEKNGPPKQNAVTCTVYNTFQ